VQGEGQTKRLKHYNDLALFSQEKEESAANELKMANVGGVFLVMLAGLCCACVIALIERCISNKRKKYKVKESH